ARDGTPLARGPGEGSPLGGAALSAAGELGPLPADRALEAWRLGFPPGAPVGVSGLERVLDERLAGRPGGALLAGGRVLARTEPRAARPVRTAIDPSLQRASVAALGDRLGGVAALRPATGEVLALAGLALDGLQPPGSTFKIVTLAAALEARVTTPRARFPVQTAATLSGVELQNANGEACGGVLGAAFAHSCNSVFAPLGARLGARRLVAAAERFGFNRPPGLPGAATSTIPRAAELGDELAVGSTAIGQGRVLATPLQMAWTAATIAADGRRPRLTAEPRDRAAPGPAVLDPHTAAAVTRMMERVVGEGTGRQAALPGVRVAGKTGTAELRTTQGTCPAAPDPAGCATSADDTTDTDAWFAAFAPARRPEVAVGVLLVRAGTGGDTAAPAARLVLEAALAPPRGPG
ncbi:MAG: penicillin-binding transpeptidase domain-containing protein, partial [Actinomycetota bacterium]|nr:penicillin-binding transpeptidase domain-containing protein [Actinomycetota bacterium]